MQTTLTLEGGPEFNHHLEQLTDVGAGAALGRIVVAGAYVVAERAVANVVANSFDTGQLANSLAEPKVVEADRSHAVAQIGPTPQHGLYVEFGTGVYGTGPGATGQRITSKSGGLLRWTDQGGGEHFARSIAGMTPRPFLRPALDESHAEVLAAMGAAALAELRGAA